MTVLNNRLIMKKVNSSVSGVCKWVVVVVVIMVAISIPSELYEGFLLAE